MMKYVLLVIAFSVMSSCNHEKNKTTEHSKDLSHQLCINIEVLSHLLKLNIQF
jgi:hypothetical protein